MYQIEYYVEPNGGEPVREWLRSLDMKTVTVMQDKISLLHEHGLILMRTSVMKRIEGGDKDFYELRGGSGRITIYHDTSNNSFVLLHGFLKKRQREIREISLARSRLREYQSGR